MSAFQSHCVCHTQAVISLKEMDSNEVLVVVDALVYVSHALPHFNGTLIQQLRQQFVSSPGNELKGLTKLAVQLLVSSIRIARRPPPHASLCIAH